MFLTLLTSVTKGENLLALEEKSLNVSSYIIFAEDANRDALEVDSLFFMRSLPIVFSAGRTTIDANNRELQHFIRYAVPLLNGENIHNAKIRIRSAASPEGSLELNQRLSKGRRDALLKIFQEHGVSASNSRLTWSMRNTNYWLS